MKKTILLGFGVAALATTAAFAGAMGGMGEAKAYPAGFVIGGDVGYGYLSTQETDLLPLDIQHNPPTLPVDIITPNHAIGSFIWGAHIGYDIPILERFLAGFEVGYKGLGRSSYSLSDVTLSASPTYVTNQNVNISQQAIDFLVTGRFYVLNGLNIFGKVGAAYVRSKTNADYNSIPIIAPTINSPALSFSSSSAIWRIRPELAVGVSYSFKSNIDVNLMYTYINGDQIGAPGLYSAPYNNTYPTQNPATAYSYNALSVGVSYYFGST